METNDIGQKLAQLREALPFLDQRSLFQASEILLAELEALSLAEREPYAAEMARLISALESHILGLEQDVKGTDT